VVALVDLVFFSQVAVCTKGTCGFYGYRAPEVVAVLDSGAVATACVVDEGVCRHGS